MMMHEFIILIITIIAMIIVIIVIVVIIVMTVIIVIIVIIVESSWRHRRAYRLAITGVPRMTYRGRNLEVLMRWRWGMRLRPATPTTRTTNCFAMLQTGQIIIIMAPSLLPCGTLIL